MRTQFHHPNIRARILLRRIWRGIREWCGDAAYERYLKSRAKHRCSDTLLSREEFYLSQLQKKYSRVSRCC
jgi:uncharacterized short protein YbdD (DUF466 family)